MAPLEEQPDSDFPPPAAEVSISFDAGTALITLSGEIDLALRAGLEFAAEEAILRSLPVRVDLSAVTFMDSQGLAALLRARQEAESSGGSLRLEGVPARVLKLLRLTRLDSVFTVDSISTER